MIPKNPPPKLDGPGFSSELRSLVAEALTKNPADRPSARDLLQHRRASAHARAHTRERARQSAHASAHAERSL